MDSYLTGFLLVTGSTLAAVLGLCIVRKVFDLEHLKSTHDVSGVLFSCVGTLYAVLLGLVVVDAMTKFQACRDVVQAEANHLSDIYILSDCLPKERRDNIRKICVDYAHEVKNNEWKAMDDGMFSPLGRKYAVTILKDLTSFEPASENQKALFPLIVEAASEMWNCRCTRINTAIQGIPIIEWISLILGGIITIFFTYFFSVDNLKIQIFMVSMITMLISLNLFLFLLFGYPFSGDLKVHADSFDTALTIFENKYGASVHAKWD